MAIHFCAHSWEVRDTADGTMVVLSNRDLRAETVAVLVEELIELVRESGRPNLCLDFERIGLVNGDVAPKMISLDSELREFGGRLSVINANSALHEQFQRQGLDELIDINAK